jgi:all-trans-retinol dehydrogenase (NAD+)
MKDIRNKIALVTGGARGMGKLWAEHFLRDGASVVIWDLDAKLLKNTVDELNKLYPGRIKGKAVNISDRAAVYRNAKLAGKVDILVNNAGVVTGSRFTKADDKKLDAMIDVNLKGMLWTIKAFLPGMITRSCGHIVNIASAAGMIGTPYMATYNASKWGVIGLTESLKLEMEEIGARGVRFTLVCPSFVDTGMFAGVKAPLFVPMLKPEKIVRTGYRSFRRNRYLVYRPLIVNFIPFLKGIMPNACFNAITKILGVTSSMSHWHGRK